MAIDRIRTASKDRLGSRPDHLCVAMPRVAGGCVEMRRVARYGSEIAASSAG
jgi:hypothetical protein